MTKGTYTGAPGDELLPCPFCGGEARHVLDNIYSNDHRRVHATWVECAKCGAEGTHVVDRHNNDHRAEAITAWNTRAPRPAENLDALKHKTVKYIEECHARYDRPCLDNIVEDTIDHLAAWLLEVIEGMLILNKDGEKTNIMAHYIHNTALEALAEKVRK